MPISKKRFGRSSQNRLQNDMMEAKRARFKDSEGGMNLPQRRRFDGSVPAEAREDPLMRRSAADAGGAKTSEFAYFKKLKQRVGHTSRVNPVNRESIQMRNFSPSKNGRDSGAPMSSRKLSRLDDGSPLRSQDAPNQSSRMRGKLDDDAEQLECSPIIRTPTMIDLDNIVSTSATAFLNPGGQPKDGDIFSSKRHKLQQWISETLFLEADKLPKECDVVSVLMSRLLPEGSSQNPSGSKNDRDQELKDNYQKHLHDSGIEFEECLNDTQKLIQTNVTHSIDADNMLLEFNERNKHGSFLNKIDFEHLSDMIYDRSLLTWSNEHSVYSPQCKTNGNIFKTKLDDHFYHGFDSDRSCRSGGRNHSYELPTICYDQVSDNRPRRNCLKYKDERPDCKWDRIVPDSWCPVLSETFGSSELGPFRFRSSASDNLRDLRPNCQLDSRASDSWFPISSERFGSSALGLPRDSAELNEFVIRGQPGPLLLSWGTDDANVKPSPDLTLIKHEVHPPSWSDGGHPSFDSSTSLSIYPSIFPSNSILDSISDLLQDHDTQSHRLLLEDRTERSSCSPSTILYGEEPEDQVSPNDDGLFKDVLRASRFSVISEDHHMGNMMSESVVPSASALLNYTGLDSLMRFRNESLPDCIEEQYDRSTDDVYQPLRHTRPSSQFLSEYENCLRLPQAEESPLMNIDYPVPLQPHKIRWLDTAVEANYDNLQIATLDNQITSCDFMA